MADLFDLQLIEESPLKIWELPDAVRTGAIKAYVKSLDIVFVITVAFFRERSSLSSTQWRLTEDLCVRVVLAALSAIFIKDINIKPPKKTDDKTASSERDLEGGTAVASLSGEEKKDKSVVGAEGETARAEGA